MDFEIMKAEMKDAETIFAIMDEMDKMINDRNIFVSDTFDYIKKHIEENGFTLKALWDSEIAGFMTILIPGLDEKNLGYDLNYSEEKMLLAAHMDTVAVLPKFRGHGLQKKLISESEKILGKMGYKVFFATVYPENKASLNSFLNTGYKIGATKEKYGGVLRHILYKEI